MCIDVRVLEIVSFCEIFCRYYGHHRVFVIFVIFLSYRNTLIL